MGLWNRIMGAFRSRDDDEYEYDDDYDEGYDDEYEGYDDDDDDGYEDEPIRPSSSGRRRNSDYYREEVESRTPRSSSTSTYSSSKRSNITPLRRSMELTLVRPGEMSDAQQISDCLLAGKTVVLNMESIIQTELAQRVLDFTSGATYTLDGKLQKVSNAIFVVTPSSVDLSGDFQNIINNSETLADTPNLNVRMS